MLIFNKIIKLQQYLSSQNKTISLVATMGGLHSGHISLIKTAKQNSQIVVVTIFINPAQFAKNEDFDKYPRNIDSDIIKLKNAGTNILFSPNINEIYHKNYSFDYKIGYLDTILCSKDRPIFFSGVTKIVYRLFEIIQPNIAIFGEKDYQQLLIIKQMVQDFNLPIKIINAPIYREKNGLAQSTRNQYLNKKQSQIAANLNKILNNAAIQINKQKIECIIKQAKKQLEQFFIIDYFEILNSKNLCKTNNFTTEVIILSAVKLSKVRLIDNKRINYV